MHRRFVSSGMFRKFSNDKERKAAFASDATEVRKPVWTGQRIQWRKKMGIRKQFLKTRPVCKVTFKIPETVGNTAESAYLVGEFNDWSTSANPMKRLKKGGFSTTVNLETGRSYQFRYLLGASQWENDPEADGYLPTPFGDNQNSMIQL